jgi:hypothetical protein
MRFLCFEGLIKTPWNDFFAAKNLCRDFFVKVLSIKIIKDTFLSSFAREELLELGTGKFLCRKFLRLKWGGGEW